jgi:hypothetical protein
MLKTISAALVAVSVLAAPALAAAPGKTARAPVNKTMQAPAIKAEHGKSKALNANALNANARMDNHHKHYRHHRHHKHMGLMKTNAKPHVAIKHTTPVAKRG